MHEVERLLQVLQPPVVRQNIRNCSGAILGKDEPVRRVVGGEMQRPAQVLVRIGVAGSQFLVRHWAVCAGQPARPRAGISGTLDEVKSVGVFGELYPAEGCAIGVMGQRGTNTARCGGVEHGWRAGVAFHAWSSRWRCATPNPVVDVIECRVQDIARGGGAPQRIPGAAGGPAGDAGRCAVGSLRKPSRRVIGST